MSTSLLRDTQYIRKMAQAANIKVTDDACKLIAFEVESVLRLVIQNAHKYTKHFNREVLRLEDINHAIKDLNILDTVYGYEDNEPNTYKKELDVWVMKPKITDLDQLLKKEILALKPEPAPQVSINWLVVNGSIPKIPENANIVSLKDKEAIKAAVETNENKDVNLKNVLIKEVSDNFLSKELQLFWNDVLESIKAEEISIDMTPTGKTYKMSSNFKKILVTLRNSPGLNSITPVLTNFLYQQHENVVMNGVLKKTNLARIILSHAFNLNFNLEFHLHIFIKILLCFITSNKLSINYTNNDIPKELYLREISAKALATLIIRYEEKYFNLKYNIATTLMGIFEKEPTNYHTLYGILKVFFYLDPNIIKDFLLRRLSNKLDISQLFVEMYRVSEMGSKHDKPKNGAHGQPPHVPKVTYSVRSIVAQHVYSALLELCNKVMSNIPLYSSKSLYESVNLYNFVTDIFGEASLIAPSSTHQSGPFEEIAAEQSKDKMSRFGYLCTYI